MSFVNGAAFTPDVSTSPVDPVHPPTKAELTETSRFCLSDIHALAAFLPEDILRIIFEDVHTSIDNRRWDDKTPRFYQLAMYSHVACVLVSVFRHWRDVGLRTPRIWATIYLRWPSSR